MRRFGPSTAVVQFHVHEPWLLLGSFLNLFACCLQFARRFTVFELLALDSRFGARKRRKTNKAPINQNSEAIRLNAMSDVEGLDRAYAIDNGIDIRNNTMVLSGTKDWPQDQWEFEDIS